MKRSDVARRAFEHNPVSAAFSHNLAVQLALARKYELAIEECRRTVDLDPTFGLGYDVMAGTFVAKGMIREALPLMEKALALNPANAMTRAVLGSLRANLGEREQALKVLDELAAAAKTRYVPAQPSPLCTLGCMMPTTHLPGSTRHTRNAPIVWPI